MTVFTVDIDIEALTSTFVKVQPTPDVKDIDDWKRNIEARDRLNLTCLPSFLASILYPKLAYSQERIAALETDYPGLMARIHEAARRDGALISRTELEFLRQKE